MRIPKILILNVQEGFMSDIVHLSYRVPLSPVRTPARAKAQARLHTRKHKRALICANADERIRKRKLARAHAEGHIRMGKNTSTLLHAQKHPHGPLRAFACAKA